MGPGTKLKKRLDRGDTGINELDKACKEHDIVYSEHKSGKKRRTADENLGKFAWKRVKSSNASFGERLNALAVAGIMKTKVKLGLGAGDGEEKMTPICSKPSAFELHNLIGTKKPNCKNRSKKTTLMKKKVLSNAIKDAECILSVANPTSVDEASKFALLGATASLLKQRISKKKLDDHVPRVILVPKVGGMLPLVPVFAALSALGALMGGASSVTNAVIATKNAKENFDEANRHNKMMEAIALGKNKTGDGVYLKPYKKGLGVYLKPQQSKSLAAQKSKNF